jgi:hypothetical protein
MAPKVYTANHVSNNYYITLDTGGNVQQLHKTFSKCSAPHVSQNLLCPALLLQLASRPQRPQVTRLVHLSIRMQSTVTYEQRPCHGSGGYSPAFHRGGPGSIPAQSMWDLWWTKSHWDRFFSPSTSDFPCQFHSTAAPLHEKTEILIIFITGLHSKPQGCGASVASAAGPFTKKNI